MKLIGTGVTTKVYHNDNIVLLETRCPIKVSLAKQKIRHPNLPEYIYHHEVNGNHILGAPYYNKVMWATEPIVRKIYNIAKRLNNITPYNFMQAIVGKIPANISEALTILYDIINEISNEYLVFLDLKTRNYMRFNENLILNDIFHTRRFV